MSLLMLISLVHTSTKLITKHFCDYNPYECRLGVQHEKLNMEIKYLEEIYHSVYKMFLSAIDHLDYHHSMNGTK